MALKAALLHSGTVPALERTYVQRERLRVGPATVPCSPAPVVFLFDRDPATLPDLQASDMAGVRSRGVLLEVACLEPGTRPVHDDAADQGFHVSGALSQLLTGAGLLGRQPGVITRSLAAMRPRHLERRPVADFSAALELGDWMRAHRMGQIYVTLGGRAADVARVAAAAWGVSVVLSTRGSDAWTHLDGATLRCHVEAAAVVLCDSQFCRSGMMLKLPPALWKKLVVVPPGVDPAALTPALRARPDQGRPVQIVCAAPLVVANGHRILLQAMAALKQGGLPFCMKFVGDGPERQPLAALAREYDVSDCLGFSPAASEEACLREADMFVLPSLGDSLPMALLTAMALGLPCVSTTVAAIPELIQSGRDGILVPPSSAEALADAVSTLANDTALRQFLGRSARRRVVCDYNLALNQEHLLRCLFASSE